MIRKLVQVSAAVLTAVLVFASTGSAQTWDVSGGYAYRNESGGEGQPRLAIEKGWYGAGGFNFNDSLGVFGQISQHSESFANDTVDVKLSIVGGGPRLTGNPRSGVTYFVNALFGAATIKSKLNDVSLPSPPSRFAFQPAIGVDVKAGGTVGVRFEFAPTYIKPESGEDEDAWAYHFMVGIVVRGG
jgi:Outer membrane protein beta-barrel domain